MSFKRLVLVTTILLNSVAAIADGSKTIKLELNGNAMFNDYTAELSINGIELSDQIANALLNSSATLRSILITAHAEPRNDAETYAQNMASTMQARLVAQGLGSLLVDTLSLAALQPSRATAAKRNPQLHRRVELTITGTNLPHIKLTQAPTQATSTQVQVSDKAPAPLPNSYIKHMQAIKDHNVEEKAYQSNWLFTRNGSNISKAGKRALKKLVKKIKANGNAQKIIVIGHANGFVNERTNRSYSLSHARAVERYLTQLKIKRPIQSITLGSRLPYADMTTAEGRKKNRRVEVLIVGKKRMHSTNQLDSNSGL